MHGFFRIGVLFIALITFTSSVSADTVSLGWAEERAQTLQSVYAQLALSFGSFSSDSLRDQIQSRVQERIQEAIDSRRGRDRGSSNGSNNTRDGNSGDGASAAVSALQATLDRVKESSSDIVVPFAAVPRQLRTETEEVTTPLPTVPTPAAVTPKIETSITSFIQEVRKSENESRAIIPAVMQDISATTVPGTAGKSTTKVSTPVTPSVVGDLRTKEKISEVVNKLESVQRGNQVLEREIKKTESTVREAVLQSVSDQLRKGVVPGVLPEVVYPEHTPNELDYTGNSEEHDPLADLIETNKPQISVRGVESEIEKEEERTPVNFIEQLRQAEERTRQAAKESEDGMRDEVAKASAKFTDETAEIPRTFDPAKREEVLARVRESLDSKAEERSALVRSAVVNGVTPVSDAVSKILRSPIEDISLLVEQETGVRVDLAPGVRVVDDVIKDQWGGGGPSIPVVTVRDTLSLYRDSDNDGVSDYDEVEIYGTDPINAFTAGSALTDGERVLLGLDPLGKEDSIVRVETPQQSAAVAQIFEVTSIKAVPVPVVPILSPTELPVDTLGEDGVQDVPVEVPEKVTPVVSTPASTLAFEGRALPNTFVTLYIFSTPIVVTVKTDASGVWKYTLDRELEDGNHELYVAMVNGSGNIVARSNPVPFVKQAEAVSFTPLLTPQVPEANPIDVVRANLLAVAVFAILVFALIILIALATVRFVGRIDASRS